MSEVPELRGGRGGWLILRSGERTSSSFEIPTIASEVAGPSGPVRFALGQNGEPRLLLPLRPEEDPRRVRGAPALAVEASTLVQGGQPTRFLDLTCRAAELEEVFARVADQILERIANGSGGVEAAHTTLEQFRSLLLRSPATDIDTARIAGLVGELMVLERLLKRSPDGCEVWRGPTGARHDFSRGSTGLEVKVTLGRGRRCVTVHGLEQLAEPDGGRLFLQHFEMEPVAGGLLSVSALGRAVLAAATEPEKVRELLAAAGCIDVDDEAWNTTSFRCENDTLYEVKPGFPRLVASDLPAGVADGISEVRYAIDLAVAADFRVDSAGAGELGALLVP